ncbi:Telomerase reverse transcriptase [Merluccius polli]|uniref:Telomerase reverse transcriptase n=1 Tax=Merluccius polli TaxID=89951 RepID=A0AA47NAW4_MERPO|nr:Telomerase reverse transcriptase [Merluccius polli]
MSVADMSRVLDILRLLYRHVQTLDEFSRGVVFREEGRRAALVEESDTARFKSFVRGVYVCTDTHLQQLPSRNEICTLPELLAFVLNTLKRKKKRNVLAHGYGFLSLAQEERNADQFKFQSDVTQSAAYIHGSDLWKKVSKRLGTDVTKYLLESCAVFVAVPPSCVFQVCGVPVYDRVSVVTSCAGVFLRAKSRANAGNPRRGRRAAGCRTRKRGGRRNASKDGGRARDSDQRKRKRGEMTVGMVRAGKRMRIDADGTTQETTQGCIAAGGNVHPSSMEVPKKPAEGCSADSKLQVTMSKGALPLEGGPSWRSGFSHPLPPSQCFIRTMGMLYGGKGMRGFLLNRKKRSRTEVRQRLQGRDLVRIVFFEGVAYLNGVEKKPRKLPRRFFNTVPVFDRLLRRHRGCPYGSVLQKACPLRLEEPGVAVEAQGDLSALLPLTCPPQRVYVFIRECLSAVVPTELWGSEHNRVHFLLRVKSFLRSGKFERLSLAELLWKMRVNDCDWLKISKTGHVPPSELAYRTRVLGQFLAWLLDGYVLGLVRACFYVTESMVQKNTLRFYRHEVWAKLQELAFRGHVSKGQLEELSPAQVASLPKTAMVSSLRFIPKADSMRPITRVIKANAKSRHHQSNMRELLDVLGVCARSAPPLLGFTVWGMNDIHQKLRPLAATQKDKPQRLYFVKVDVSGAYESLPHDKIIEVIGQALTPVQEDAFVIRRYAKIWSDAHEGLKKSFTRQADFMEDNIGSTNMKGFVMTMQRERKLHNAILVEQTFSSDLHGRDALQFFTQMLTGGVVKFGKKMFRQYRGIPQGSVVSSLLCCLCYGHMENNLFKDMNLNGGCLMRLVDDFLLITPDLHQAQTFFKTLLAGVQDYGLVVNPQKVVVNFQVSEDLGASPKVRMLPASCLFPWCGLLLDTHTLDVYKDYSSYAGLSLRYSFTLGFSQRAGVHMKKKLMGLLRLKCHAIFLDFMSNSVEAVYSNVYKLVLLHAWRFHVCAQSLPFGQTVAKNPAYFLHMILDMAAYTGVLQREAVELLFCLAFSLVLSRHRPQYRALLPGLHKRKRCLERRLGDIRLARVRQATKPRIPQEFQAMRT